MLRVGVFFGGPSSEREVSLESGRHLFQNLDAFRYGGVPIFLSKKHELWEVPIKLLLMNTTEDIERALETDATRIPYEQLKEKIDFAALPAYTRSGYVGVKVWICLS